MISTGNFKRKVITNVYGKQAYMAAISGTFGSNPSGVGTELAI